MKIELIHRIVRLTARNCNSLAVEEIRSKEGKCEKPFLSGSAPFFLSLLQWRTQRVCCVLEILRRCEEPRSKNAVVGEVRACMRTLPLLPASLSRESVTEHKCVLGKFACPFHEIIAALDERDFVINVLISKQV
jgi:hypothetical protein